MSIFIESNKVSYHIIMKRILSFIFAAAVLAGCVSGPVAPETVQSKIVEDGGTGPYKAIMFEVTAVPIASLTAENSLFRPLLGSSGSSRAMKKQRRCSPAPLVASRREKDGLWTRMSLLTIKRTD